MLQVSKESALSQQISENPADERAKVQIVQVEDVKAAIKTGMYSRLSFFPPLK